jgi:hypothetical protein
MVGDDTDGGVVGYMVVGKRGGGKSLAQREGENWKRPNG